MSIVVFMDGLLASIATVRVDNLQGPRAAVNEGGDFAGTGGGTAPGG
jgi:hypothetical protein